MFGSTIRRKVVERPGAERGGRLLHLAVELEQHRLHGAHDERQRHEQQREHDRRAGVGDMDAERALRPVEREQHEPGDDRRQRERQVDHRVDELLADELVADEHPGDRVPVTAWIPATIADAAMVSFSAASASGEVTTCQKTRRPAVRASAQTTAASGIRTTSAEVDASATPPARAGPSGPTPPRRTGMARSRRALR